MPSCVILRGNMSRRGDGKGCPPELNARHNRLTANRLPKKKPCLRLWYGRPFIFRLVWALSAKFGGITVDPPCRVLRTSRDKAALAGRARADETDWRERSPWRFNCCSADRVSPLLSLRCVCMFSFATASCFMNLSSIGHNSLQKYGVDQSRCRAQGGKDRGGVLCLFANNYFIQPIASLQYIFSLRL